MNKVDLDNCHKSIEVLKAILPSIAEKPDSPKYMQLVGHPDVKNICKFLDYAEKTQRDLVELTNSLVVGIGETISLLKANGKRDEVIKLLNDVLQKNDFKGV